MLSDFGVGVRAIELLHDGREGAATDIGGVEDFLVVPHHLAVGDLEHFARDVTQACEFQEQVDAVGLVLEVFASDFKILAKELTLLLEVGGDGLESFDLLDGFIEDFFGFGGRGVGRVGRGCLGPGEQGEKARDDERRDHPVLQHSGVVPAFLQGKGLETRSYR